MGPAVTLPPGYRLVPLERVESTNSEAMGLAAAGDPGRVWVTAGEQVKGRGRSGRVWASGPGNLYASLLLRLGCPAAMAQQMALVAGVAVIDAIRSLGTMPEAGPAPAGLRLKWPNDVLIGTAKVGGILLESSQGLGGPGLVTVVGIGLNVAGVPDGLGRSATSLASEGLHVDRAVVLSELAAAMDRALKVWDEGSGFATIRDRWQASGGRHGEPLIVRLSAGPVSGSFGGLDVDGALLLLDAMGVAHRFTYGDVSLAEVDDRQ